MRGVPAAPGQALGPTLVYRGHAAATSEKKLENDPVAVAREQARVEDALAGANVELMQLAKEVRLLTGPEEAAIFEAQALMAVDPAMLDGARDLVATDLLRAAPAILATAEEQAAVLAALDDPYLQARAADLRDVGARAARIARKQPASNGLSRLARSVIVLASDLTPSETALIDREHVLGIALSGGGPTSHAAIVARALGVPLVCQVEELPDVEGLPALLDGNSGELVLYPDQARLASYTDWNITQQAARSRQATLRSLPAQTLDGARIKLAANAGSVAEARDAARYGSEGIGLLRTEFLFLDHEPGETEQFEAYSHIYAAMPRSEVIVRTMDLGGDKPPPYLDFGSEANPFLGWRGLRVALDRQPMLRAQVKALLRAGEGRTVSLMFPMVSTLDEFRRARDVVNAVRDELAAGGVPSADKVILGIMIEVPSAALMAPEFAREVDFFSIGTNDLTQYTMATDRGASRVTHLYSPVQPGVLRLIKLTVEAAHAEGRWVGICGEAAGNPDWATLWLGLGLDELSMTAALIPAVKETIRGALLSEAQALAERALKQATLADVERLLRSAKAP